MDVRDAARKMHKFSRNSESSRLRRWRHKLRKRLMSVSRFFSRIFVR